MTWRWGIIRGVKWTRCRHVFIISYYDLKGQNKLGRYTYLVVLHIFQHILHILQWSTRLSVCLLYVWMFIMSVSPIRCFFLCCHSLLWALSPISKGLILIIWNSYSSMVSACLSIVPFNIQYSLLALLSIFFQLSVSAHCPWIFETLYSISVEREI